MMKFLPLITANLLRKKLRTGLTLGSLAIAFFLFGLLIVLHVAFSQHGQAGTNRLVVVNKVSIIRPLPYSYKSRLEGVAGVTGVTFMSWFGGIYQDERNSFPQYAIDQSTYLKMFPEFVVAPDQWQAFLADREGSIVGSATAERFHWKVGDRVPLKGTIYPGLWEFNVRGIYHARPQDNLTQFWMRYDYLDERAVFNKGTVGWYFVRVAEADDSGRVAQAIDDLFSNSPNETKTETENSFMTAWLKQVGDIEALILSVGAVVFFTLLLVTGNTMSIALRERVRELALLKAIGFSSWFVMCLVLAESLIIAVIGGSLGLGLAKLFTLRGDPTHLLGYFNLPLNAILTGVLLTAAVGIVSAILPALSAMQLTVIDGLRRI
jgi:putative ABC transport system permease protein